MAVRYRSTRSDADPLSFADVLLAGLAPDGGLYVPSEWPQLDVQRIESLVAEGYRAVATEVMFPFVEESIERDEFAALVADAYGTFSHPDVCPLIDLEPGHHLLELFHGPTLAFKDVALQLVGRLFDHELQLRDGRVTIVGATSGDTGSAAIEAVRDRDRIDIVVLYPEGRTSEVQRRQMTTVVAPNVSTAAIEGTFDDCQDLVKAMFADVEFRERVGLSAVNSINWARVMAQVVYYVWASARLGRLRQPTSFCVPTGNFGNIFAGHVARHMGLPVDRLMVASNTNDILTRLLETGEMVARDVVPTLSPSMDIQISSNLERLLFELFDHSPSVTSETMGAFREAGRASLTAGQHRQLTEGFVGERCDDDAALAVIRDVHQRTGLILDPHTAVGVGVANRLRRPDEVVVSLATAHPAKFPDAVERAIGSRPQLPAALADLLDRDERTNTLANDLKTVEEFVEVVRRT